MRRALFIAVLGILSIWGGSAMANPLAAVRWEQRVLLLFGREPAIQEQMGKLAIDENGLIERRLLVLSVDATVETFAGQPPAMLPSATDLRRQFGVDADSFYTAVLVGLDGGEKWRSTEITAPETIFAVIDAMPMRRAGSEPPRQP
ncbi:DUF4174 domain-containing protein [Aureimonas jatrophae]|nr:DUF4174 domain-containing protein [Aureimonas jatrophae]MBB3949791.1 hypothetical protein [Aureimonas jatrophae]